MHDTKRTPPRDDAGGRGQHVPGGTSKIIPAAPAGVNADLPPGMVHISRPLSRVMADLRRRMILKELDRLRDAVARLREACE